MLINITYLCIGYYFLIFKPVHLKHLSCKKASLHLRNIMVFLRNIYLISLRKTEPQNIIWLKELLSIYMLTIIENHIDVLNFVDVERI